MASNTLQTSLDDMVSSKHPTVTHLRNSNLWQQLKAGTADADFYPAWLELQCSLIGGVYGGAVFSVGEKGDWNSLCTIPQGNQPAGDYLHLLDRVKAEKRGVVVQPKADQQKIGQSTRGRVILGYPIIEGESAVYVVILELQPRSSAAIETAMRQLQWGIVWLSGRLIEKRYGEKTASQQDRLNQLQTALDIVDATVKQSNCQDAALTVCTLLAERFGCERVSIGFLHNRRMRLAAVSHMQKISREQNLIKATEAMMDESCDQKEMLIYPDEDQGKGNALYAHRKYDQQFGPVALCTIPLLTTEGSCYGAIGFERSRDKPLNSKDSVQANNITQVVGAIIEEKRQNDKSLPEKVLTGWKKWRSQNRGSDTVFKKSAFGVLGLCVFVLFFITGEYRVGANVTLEGSVQRVVIAPFDGFIDEAPMRAGDIVKADQVLAGIDTRELVLERIRWNSQKRQYFLEYHKAIAENQVAQSKIIQEQVEQANARIALLDEQISRGTILAPFDGVIIRGDLSRTIGIPVKRGDVLFEVAPLDSYRIKLEVHEKNIDRIEHGQHGEFVVNAMPEEVFEFIITSITPVSMLKDGQTYFRVEGKLGSSSEKLRPGMQGIGKITIGQEKLVWIWTHEITDMVRLWLWSVIP